MSFILSPEASPQTRPFDFKKLLEGVKDDLEIDDDFVTQLDRTRDRLVVLLRDAHSHHSVELCAREYLTHLRTLETSIRNAKEKEPVKKGGLLGLLGGTKKFTTPPFAFTWRSVLSRGILRSVMNERVEKPDFKVSTLYFEQANVVLSLAYLQIKQLNKQQKTDSLDVSDAFLSEGADLLRGAAGIFAYVRTRIIPELTYSLQWKEDGGGGKLGKATDLPPDCDERVLAALEELLLADASRLVMQKAQRTAKSPLNVIKIGMDVVQRYEVVAEQLQRLTGFTRDEISRGLLDYVTYGKLLMEAQLLRSFGQLKYGEEESGVAVGCMSLAQANLKRIVTAGDDCKYTMYRRMAAGMLADVEREREEIARINNNVNYKKVPSHEEIRGLLPSAVSLVSPKEFTLSD